MSKVEGLRGKKIKESDVDGQEKHKRILLEAELEEEEAAKQRSVIHLLLAPLSSIPYWPAWSCQYRPLLFNLPSCSEIKEFEVAHDKHVSLRTGYDY